MQRAILVGLCSLFSLPALAATADDIKNLMDSRQFQAAYDLGKQHSEELGQPLFDFFFGIAAIDSNAPGEGVLALERYLNLFPDNRSARFHLARGYYVLGEDQIARTTFADLLSDAETKEAETIQQFLDAIRARESRYAPTAAFFAEAGLGHDSNINGGVHAGTVAGLPSTFIVANGATQEKEASGFNTLNLGAQGTLPIAPGVALYGGGQVGGKWHFDKADDIFDQRNISLQGGASILKGRNLFRIGGEYANINIDNQRYLSIASLIGEWNHQVDQFNRLSLGLQWSQLRYQDITIFLDKQKNISTPSQANLRNSNLYLMNAAWTHAFVSPLNPVLSVTANLGQERNSESQSSLSRDIFGGRVNLSLQPLPKWSTNLALSYQHSRYDAAFSPATSTQRRDHFYSAEASLAYAIDRNWSVRAEYTYSNQQSNIGFFDFDRHVLAAKVRYDFK